MQQARGRALPAAPRRAVVVKLVRARSHPRCGRLTQLSPRSDPAAAAAYGVSSAFALLLLECARSALLANLSPLHFSLGQTRPSDRTTPSCLSSAAESTPAPLRPLANWAPIRCLFLFAPLHPVELGRALGSPLAAVLCQDWRVSRCLLLLSVSLPCASPFSECPSAPLSLSDSLHHTWCVCLFTCPPSTCLSLTSTCRSYFPSSPSLSPNSTNLYLFCKSENTLRLPLFQLSVCQEN